MNEQKLDKKTINIISSLCKYIEQSDKLNKNKDIKENLK